MTTSTETKNIFTDLPVHGTILGVATQEEVATMQDIGWRMASIREAAGETNYVNQYQKLQSDWYNAWLTLLQRIGVPYAWPVAIDYSTGYVYVDNK